MKDLVVIVFSIAIIAQLYLAILYMAPLFTHSSFQHFCYLKKTVSGEAVPPIATMAILQSLLLI